MNTKRYMFLMLLLVVAQQTVAQISVEQYHYFGAEQPLVWAPVIHYQNPNSWYAEMRYNYEDNRTLSLYTGRTFAHNGSRLSYSATPLVGGVVGKFKGGSMGLNLEVDFMNLFFASQSQYSFGLGGERTDFIFAWSELGYRLQPWLFGGVSAQHTYLYQDERNLLEPGVFLGVEFGAWSFPLYSFVPSGSEPFFVLGINFNPGK